VRPGRVRGAIQPFLISLVLFHQGKRTLNEISKYCFYPPKISITPCKKTI